MTVTIALSGRSLHGVVLVMWTPSPAASIRSVRSVCWSRAAATSLPEGSCSQGGREASLLTAGQVGGGLRPTAVETRRVERGEQPLMVAPGPPAEDRRAHRHIDGDGLLVHHPGILQHERRAVPPEPPPLCRPPTRGVCRIDEYAAAGGRLQQPEAVQESGLA